MRNEPQPLLNSRRRYEKRTYTPLIIKTAKEGESTNALGLAAFVRALMISDAEFAELRQRVGNSPGQLTAVASMEGLATAVSASDVLKAAASLAAVSTGDLRTVSDALATIRTEVTDNLVSGLQALYGRFVHTNAYGGTGAQPRLATAQSGLAAASTERTDQASDVPHVVAIATSHEAHSTGNMPSPSRSVSLHLPTATRSIPQIAALSLASSRTSTAGRGSLVSPTATSSLLRYTVGPELAERAAEVTMWAINNAADHLGKLATAARPYAAASSNDGTAVVDALTNLTRLRLLPHLFADALTQRPLQPLGLLHLERLEMTPLDVERGELTYSLPLAPNEKVTLAHREWSVRNEQFTDFIEDQLENFSEQGVTESTDLAMSSSTQTSHDNTVNMGQPVASSNAVGVTSPVDTTKSSSSAVNDTATQEEDKSQSRTVTAMASTRTMQDHKISFTVTTVAGTEDFTAHLIENKRDDKSMRIDYFKRVRKWQSDLYRYGVRLTYDVVLPDPGAQLREREEELQRITDELATEFQLPLMPSDIQISNWEQLADQYGVALPAPPNQVQQIETTQQVYYPTPYDENTAGDGTKWIDGHRVVLLNTTVPNDFQLEKLNVFASVQMWPKSTTNKVDGWLNAYAGESTQLVNADGAGYCNLDWNLDSTQVPAEGQITVIFRMQVPESGLLRLTATVVPTESAMEKWHLTCWSAINNAARATDTLHRSYLRTQQAALQKDIASDDTIRLRRLEREAIMRAVLEWLFPGFEDARSMLTNLPAPGSLDPGKWQQVMEYGEYIKFVQTAIDWDNVVVFLYPYFWDTIWHEHEKLFLNHPDPIHREFLRAGAARVIIAIQPGYEEQVVSLLEHGQLGNLGDQSRFARAIKDVQDANAAYTQTTQGDGATENPKQPGVLIGSWTDYTPTSALDIDVTLLPVIEG